MNTLDIIDHHMIIRDTVGYEVLAEVDLMDMPKVMEFLKIVYNYQRMKQHQWDKAEDSDWDEYLKAVKEEEPQPGWEDPMIAHLDNEEERYKKSLETLAKNVDERWERQLIKDILSDPRNADGFSDDAHRLPKYNYEGYTYILNDTLTRIISVEVPTAGLDKDDPSWMDDYYDDYIKLQASGMFFEFHPDWTGQWEKDKYAFCHEQLMKKK